MHNSVPVGRTVLEGVAEPCKIAKQNGGSDIIRRPERDVTPDARVYIRIELKFSSYVRDHG